MANKASIVILLALLIPIPAVGQDLYSERIEAANKDPLEQAEENEEALVESLIEMFAGIQAANASPEGKLYRGTHSKGTCAAGTFEVFDLADDKLRVGLFAKPGSYATRVRVANGASGIFPDTDDDARALSMGVDLGDGRRQDFSMNNDPIFPIDSLRSFTLLIIVSTIQRQVLADLSAEVLKQVYAAELQKALEDGLTEDRAKALAKAQSTPEVIVKSKVGEYLNAEPWRLAAFRKVLALAARLTRKDVFSYRTEVYWSGSAFRYGENQAAKFALSPCEKYSPRSDGQPWAWSEKYPVRHLPADTGPDYLQDDFKEFVTNGDAEVCFNFHVQLLDADKMVLHTEAGDQKLEPWQWIEDTTLDWDEAGAPYSTVGKLTIHRGSIKSAAECDDVKNGYDTMNNALPEHRGLGRLNRARSHVEKASQQRRSSQ